MIRFQLSKVAGIALITGVLLSTTACRGPGRAARKACRAMHECHRAAFEAAYDSMRECMDDHLDDVDDLEREFGRQCARAYVRYGHCAARVYIRECSSADVARECEDLWDDYWDECYR